VDSSAGAPRTVVVVGIATAVGAAVRSRLVRAGNRIVGCNLTRTPATRSALINRVLDETGRVIDGLVVCTPLDGGDTVEEMISQRHYGTLEVLDGLRPALAAASSASVALVISNTIGIVPMPDGQLLVALTDEGEGVAQQVAATMDPPEVQAIVDVALARAVRARVVPWGRAGIRINAVAAGSMRGADGAPGRGPVRPPADGGRPGGSLRSMLEALPVPRNRPVEPGEVARVVEFLVDPASAALHGAVLFADGGTEALVRPDVV